MCLDDKKWMLLCFAEFYATWQGKMFEKPKSMSNVTTVTPPQISQLQYSFLQTILWTKTRWNSMKIYSTIFLLAQRVWIWEVTEGCMSNRNNRHKIRNNRNTLIRNFKI